VRLSIDRDMKCSCADSYWLESSSSNSMNAACHLMRFKNLEFREARFVCEGMLRAAYIKEYH